MSAPRVVFNPAPYVNDKLNVPSGQIYKHFATVGGGAGGSLPMEAVVFLKRRERTRASSS